MKALEIKENGQRYVNELLEGMSREEELQFWHERYLEMVEARKNPESLFKRWESLKDLLAKKKENRAK